MLQAWDMPPPILDRQLERHLRRLPSPHRDHWWNSSRTQTSRIQVVAARRSIRDSHVLPALAEEAAERMGRTPWG